MKYLPVSGKRFNRWPSIYFLVGISLVTIIGCPIYLYFFGISPVGIWTFVGMSVATLMSITAGYHRLYSHKAYEAHPLFHFFMLGFGAASLQQSALKWASLHRYHHRYTDTPNDPYNIKKGFFYAHIGWILFWIRSVNTKNVKDLYQNKLLMHQHHHFQLWATVFGILIPFIFGVIYGNVAEALLFGVIARLFFVFQFTFFINSFAHTFGSQKYDKNCTARDNWMGAFLTFGEGYHSFHHKFEHDYRNGYKWYHWDPSKWFIYFCSLFRLTSHLRKTPSQEINNALIASS